MMETTELPVSDSGRNPRPALKSPAVLLATWFGSGYLPKAPGTWGSLAALPVAWAILTHLGVLWLLGLALGLFFAGIWASRGYMAKSGTHDPGPVVIDEVVGQWLVVSAVPLDLAWFAAGFAAFRFFDIVKPWPVRLLDNRLGGGFGVMADDVGAAVYGIGVLLFVQVLIENLP